MRQHYLALLSVFASLPAMAPVGDARRAGIAAVMAGWRYIARRPVLRGSFLSDLAATVPSTSNAQAPMPLRMRGTVKKFSATTGILSLSTANGTAEFKLAAETRIRQDSRTIEAGDLEKLVGWHAVVHYREGSADRTVESVHVFGGS